MSDQIRGRQRSPDYTRVHRADEPRLRHPVPAMTTLLENANQVLAKQAFTLNRAGSTEGNPILAGLGVHAQNKIGIDDTLLGVFLYQHRANMGINRYAEVQVEAPGSVAL